MTIRNRVSSQVILSSAAGVAAAAEAVAAPGQALFGTNTGTGTFSWTVPPNVKTISVVAIGGGGGCGYIPTNSNQGGGGGGLGWKNNIAVQPGSNITVVVGAGGTRYSFGAYPGNESYVINNTTVRGGAGGYAFGSGFTTYVGDGGGNGGQSYFFQSAGGGAGGYSGNGGNGYIWTYPGKELHIRQSGAGQIISFSSNTKLGYSRNSYSKLGLEA